MAELREEEYTKAVEAGASPQQAGAGTPGTGNVLLVKPVYLTDAQIETDREAFIPDEYIGSSSEKLRLYRELDNIANEDRLEKFRSELIDRFGDIPTPTEELFDIVRLRWLCVELGFEKAIVKNGILILKFIENPHSAYYQSSLFGAILKVSTRPGGKFVFRQNNNKLSVVVRNIKDVAAATGVLRELQRQVAQEQGSLIETK